MYDHPYCECCGGQIPQEGSEQWIAAKGGPCPGLLATDKYGRVALVCGAFDPELDNWVEIEPEEE